MRGERGKAAAKVLRLALLRGAGTIFWFCLLLTSHFSPLTAQQPIAAPSHLQKLAHTYSIVAYDSTTGDLGVAVQSKFPNVGGIVPWGRAGVGAVATQSLGNTAYGERGLDLMAEGASAEEALRIVMRTDTMMLACAE